jgi:hypothetical protein
MRFHRVLSGLALVVIAFGAWMALWGGNAFELFGGYQLPQPVAEDESAMAVWAGVSFARVTGALILGLGALLFAILRRRNRDQAVGYALLAAAVFGLAIALTQQMAVWRGWVSLLLPAAFVVIGLAAAAYVVAVRRQIDRMPSREAT